MTLMYRNMLEVTGFDWWKLAGMLLPLFISFIAAYPAYKYAVKQLNQSHNLALKQIQSQHDLALKQVENENAFINSTQKI